MQVVMHDYGVAGRRRRRLVNRFELLAEMAYLSYPYLIWCARSLCSLWNFAARFIMGKLESWGYPVVKLHDPNFNRF